MRPVKKEAGKPVDSVHVSQVSGLTGDHETKEHRRVTLISKEALELAARELGKDSIDPADTRRNILVSGLDFSDLENRQIVLGEALIEVTGLCHPCSRMDETIGPGGRTALANRGGLTARVVRDGNVRIGDKVLLADKD